MDYTPIEYCDMIIIYGECVGNANVAAQEYAIRFPERRAPSSHVILRLINRVRQTGSVLPRRNIDAGRERYARTYENEEAVLLMCEEDPSTSIRQMSRRLNISKSSVQLILKENQMHAYHFTKVHNLLPQDYARRINFCTWLLAQEPDFIQTILFSDESCFTREGSFNMHNSHIWSNENPHEYHIRNYQHRFSINLWAGIQNNLIVSYSHCTYFLIFMNRPGLFILCVITFVTNDVISSTFNSIHLSRSLITENRDHMNRGPISSVFMWFSWDNSRRGFPLPSTPGYLEDAYLSRYV